MGKRTAYEKRERKGGADMRSVKAIRAAKTGYIIISLLFCALGILLIAVPGITAPALAGIFGALLILFGIVKMIGYFSKDLFRLAFQYDLALGLLLMVLGMIMIWKADNVMAFISVALGIYVLADGLLKIQIALDARVFGIRRWWMILAMAVAAGLIGCILIVYPAKSAGVLAVLLGCSVLAEGILNLLTVLLAVRIIRHQRPDRMELL